MTTSQDRAPMIALTGGPCGGTSTGAAVLRERLSDFGVHALVVPEAATQVFTSGIRPDEIASSDERWRAFQSELTRMVIELEERWQGFARLVDSDRTVLICDRGVMDAAAYVDRAVFERVLEDLDLSVADVRDRRYAAVFHLVTAARGAEEHYNLDNPARTETPEEARQLDRRTARAWVGHRNLQVLPNSEPDPDGGTRSIGFDEKMDRLVAGVCRVLDLPVPRPLERKFLLSTPPALSDLPEAARHARIEQVYLRSQEDGLERRLRRSVVEDFGAGGCYHVYTEKRTLRAGVRTQRERILSARDYQELLVDRDPERGSIHKDRYSFLYRDQYFQLDLFRQPVELALLEVTVTEQRPSVDLPPFLEVDRDVTEEDDYWNARISAGALASVS